MQNLLESNKQKKLFFLMYVSAILKKCSHEIERDSFEENIW